MRVALDTNVLAYAEGVNGSERRERVLDVVRRLPPGSAVIPVQVLGELFNVLVRKAGRSRGEAPDAIQGWRDAMPIVASSRKSCRRRWTLRLTISSASGTPSFWPRLALQDPGCS